MTGRSESRPEVAAVLWDMGGIVYRFFTELLLDLGRERGWPLERLPLGPTGLAPDPWYAAMDRGESDEPAYVDAVVAALAREGIAFSPHRHLDLTRNERPETWEVIRRLHEAGFRQAVLTNDATRWLGENWWEDWPPRRWFEAIVDVHTLGTRKPSPEPYLACASALGVPPENCLFVDDLHVNCVGAEAVGMQSCWFDITAPDASLGRLLEQLGV